MLIFITGVLSIVAGFIILKLTLEIQFIWMVFLGLLFMLVSFIPFGYEEKVYKVLEENDLVLLDDGSYTEEKYKNITYRFKVEGGEAERHTSSDYVKISLVPYGEKAIVKEVILGGKISLWSFPVFSFRPADLLLIPEEKENEG